MARTCILLLALIATVRPSAAALPRIEARSVRTGRVVAGLILINRHPALHLMTPFGGRSPTERARSAAEHLRDLLDDGHLAWALEARAIDSRWSVVTPGGTVLVSATRSEARAQRTRPPDLARRWAARMRHLLTLPVVALPASRIVVPLGESRSLRIGGIAEGGFSVGMSAGADVAHASLRGRRLIVTGTAVGRAQVSVVAELASTRCAVDVKKYAGRLNAQMSAEVTGAPAPPSLISSAAALAIRRYLPAEPGATVSIVSPPTVRRPLRPGGAAVVFARARVAGGGHIPVEGPVRVVVRDRVLPEIPAARLFYSNSPERIARAGVLFSAHLDGDAPARLFYHHMNGSGGVLALEVTLLNRGTEPVELQIVPGFAPSDPDAVRAGHLAGSLFFPRLVRNVGAVLTIPAGSCAPLVIHRLAPGRTASGLAEVRLLSPGSCTVRVAATPWRECSWPVSTARLDAWCDALPRRATASELADPPSSPNVFPQPLREVEADYTIGKTWTWVRLGVNPITDVHGRRRLDGNYGVVYRIRIQIRNPHPQPRTAEVAFEAGAGQASGVFIIGDRFVEVHSLLPLQERGLARFAVGPGQTRGLLIETLPLGGSSYPASLIIR